MNKKIIYLTLFLVLALFLISSCSKVKGVKTEQKEVANEEVSGWDKFGDENIQPTTKQYRACCLIGGSSGSMGVCTDDRLEVSAQVRYCPDQRTKCRNDGGYFTTGDINSRC
jgi:hypothetical protein